MKIIKVSLAFLALILLAPCTEAKGQDRGRENGARESRHENVTSFMVMKGTAPLNISDAYTEEIWKSLDGKDSAWRAISIDRPVPIQDAFSQGGSGNSVIYPFVIKSAKPFRAGQVEFTIVSGPFTTEGQLFGKDGSSPKPMRAIWFGADQVEGTSDDVVFPLVRADTIVNVLYFVGAGGTYDIGNLTIEEALAVWKPFLPEHQYIEYRLGGANISAHGELCGP
jgi:hypothetical protein